MATMLVLLGVLSQQFATESPERNEGQGHGTLTQRSIEEGDGRESSYNTVAAPQSYTQERANTGQQHDLSPVSDHHYSLLALLGYFAIGAGVCGICLRLGKY